MEDLAKKHGLSMNGRKFIAGKVYSCIKGRALKRAEVDNEIKIILAKEKLNQISEKVPTKTIKIILVKLKILETALSLRAEGRTRAKYSYESEEDYKTHMTNQMLELTSEITEQREMIRTIASGVGLNYRVSDTGSVGDFEEKK